MSYDVRISDWSSDVCSSDLYWLLERVQAEWRRRSGPIPARERKTPLSRNCSSLAPMKPVLQSITNSAGIAPSCTSVDTRGAIALEHGRESCRERVCQYV